MLAEARIFGLKFAACMACHKGPYPNDSIIRSRSGWLSFSCATAVDRSTAPGETVTVLTTCVLGAFVLSGVVMLFISSTIEGTLSVMTAIFLISACDAIHVAAASPVWVDDGPTLNMYGHLFTSA